MRKHEEKLIAIVRHIGPKLLKSRTKWLSKPQRQLVSDILNKAILEEVFLDELSKGEAQVGTVSTHADGSKWRKEAAGKWVRIGEGRGPKKESAPRQAEAKPEHPPLEYESTTAKHTDKDGKFTKERQELHDKIINDTLMKTDPVPEGERPIMIISVTGPDLEPE